MSFCQPCQGILPWLFDCIRNPSSGLWLLKPMDYDHHDSFASLQNASSLGCPLCQMFNEGLSRMQPERKASENQRNRQPCRLRLLADEPVQLSYKVHDPGKSLDLQFYSLPSNRPTIIVSEVSGHQCLDPLTALTELLFPQLLPCIINHQNCNSYLFLPTRLIDVGPADGSIDPVLIDSKLILERINIYEQKFSIYATLSHCWGETNHTMTTTKNIEERMSSIPLHSLSKTFQDAITIVRSLNRDGLGLRYLWIDSLCIIQDSKVDWEHESRLMSFVYSNSLINIAATSSYNDNDGILHDRVPGVELPLAPGISSPDRKSTNLWIRQISPVESSILNTRAWVLQETILAPRTIYLGHNEASFRCRTSHYAESSGAEYIAADGDLDAKKSYYSSHYNYSELISEDLAQFGRSEDVFKAWQRLVEVYSEKSLTFHHDKLVAISGIARHTFEKAIMHAEAKAGRRTFVVQLPGIDLVPEGPLTSDTPWHVEARAKFKYHAGIWSGNLLSGLCWHVRIGSLGHKYRDYIAPSWSWASQDGPIDYLWKGFRGRYWADGKDGPLFTDPMFLAKVWKISTNLSSSNSFGAVCGGSLEIEGPWIPDLGKYIGNGHTGKEEGDRVLGSILDEEHKMVDEHRHGLVLGYNYERMDGSIRLFGLQLGVPNQEASVKRRGFFIIALMNADILEELTEQRRVTIL